MANLTNAELQQIVRGLQEQVERLQAQLQGRAAPAPELPPEERPDYIAFGSDQHAAFLGLRELTEEEAEKERKKEYGLVAEGANGKTYTLVDRTAFGVGVRHEFLEAILMQKAGQLTEPKVHPDAPPMWQPAERAVKGIVV